MDINQLAKYFSQICGILALLGLVFYLPLKPHWSKRFSFFDAILFYCGIGAPALYLYFFIVRPEGVEMTGRLLQCAECCSIWKKEGKTIYGNKNIAE